MSTIKNIATELAAGLKSVCSPKESLGYKIADKIKDKIVEKTEKSAGTTNENELIELEEESTDGLTTFDEIREKGVVPMLVEDLAEKLNNKDE